MAEVDDAGTPGTGSSSDIQCNDSNGSTSEALESSGAVYGSSESSGDLPKPETCDNDYSAEKHCGSADGVGMKDLCTENANQNNNEVQQYADSIDKSSQGNIDQQCNKKEEDVRETRTGQDDPKPKKEIPEISSRMEHIGKVCEPQRELEINSTHVGLDDGCDSYATESGTPDGDPSNILIKPETPSNEDHFKMITDSESNVDRRSSVEDNSSAPREKDAGEVASKPEEFDERMSSDGGSVEIAVEAAEEQSNVPGQVVSSNLSENTLSHPHLDNTTKGDQVQHSAIDPLPIVTSSPVGDPEQTTSTESVPADEAVCPHVEQQTNQEISSTALSNASQMLPSASREDVHSGCSADSKVGDNTEDDLLSELAAELDDEEGNRTLEPSESRTEEEAEESEDFAGDDKRRMMQQVDEWKKKYCHAQAELQSLQVTMQAKSHQQSDKDQERELIAADAKREAEAIQKVHLVRIKELERELDQRTKEIAVARERQMSHDTAAKKAISKLQTEMVQRIDQVKHMYEEAVKEKENMVIRYAKSEKENLDLKKAKEEVERKRRDAGQGLEVISSHNKQLKADRAKLMADLDAKDLEITGLKRDIDQMSDDVASAGIKVKWAQNKLKTELESHKETKTKLAKTEQRLVEAKEETEQIRKNCQEMISTYQESEEIRSNSLDLQLKQKEEELKLQSREKEDQMEMHNSRLRELEALKKAHHDSIAELDSLQVKCKCLEDERLHTEGLLTQFKGLLNSQKEENRKLVKQMDELKNLKRQLEDSQRSVERLEQSIATRKEDEKDRESELERSRQKESELLQFTEKMTAKNATIHSQNLSLSAQVDSLTEECRNLKAELEEAKSEISQLTADLNQEKQYREREVAILSARLGEKTKALDQLNVQLDDAKDETKTLKRKHAANLKDLTRQLHHAKKKIESLEGDGSNHGMNKDNLSSESRTSSTGSLDTLGNTALNGGGSNNVSSGSSGGGSVGRHDDSPQSGQDHTVAITGGNDFPGIDKAMLVDRIVRLQKQLQKKGEKIEFLQEHVSQLVEELQKKSKIIQQYILREEVGALSPAVSDANKAQMSKQSGIMASVYRSHAVDPNMTLDLSLEINRKLQAVLEDTLLKNITLKENIDTLGQEIARLSEQAHHSARKVPALRKK